MNLQEIFDGDGIFLHLQGRNMAERKRTYKDDYTPSSADVLVNNFRRWLDAAAQVTATQQSTGGNAIDAVQSVTASGSDYFEAVLPEATSHGDAARRTMLDRYESPNKNCKICSQALARFQTRASIWKVLSTVMVGASGSCLSLLAISALALDRVMLLVRPTALVGVASCLLAAVANRKRRTIEMKMQQFHFVDYVHAMK